MIEKNGLPAAHLAAMTSMAKVEEFKWRKGQVQKALNAAATPLQEALIFPDW